MLDTSRDAFTVEGVTVNIPSMSEALTSIAEEATAGRSFLVCTLNLDHLVKLRSDPEFRDTYARARFVTADGFPIVMLGRIAGAHVTRTTGADLVEPLCAAAASNGLPVFLFGSTEGTLAESAKRLLARYPGLEIAGTLAPSWNFDPYSEEADRAIERISASGARLCFVALGAPRQEIFGARCLDRVQGVGFLCVGAALNFIAGTESRAPKFIQRIDLEWLWRLSHNPRRLTGRYVRCFAVFAELVMRDAIGGAFSRRKLSRAG